MMFYPNAKERGLRGHAMKGFHDVGEICDM